MKPHRSIRTFALAPIALLAALLLGAADCLACKYTVRDVAFADLDDRPYRLILPAGPGAKERLAAAASLLSGSPILPGVDADESTLDESIQELLRKNPLTDADHALLISPDGAALKIKLTGGGADAKPLSSLRDELLSPILLALPDQLMTHFAVILLIEGPDSAENQRLAKLAEEAADKVEASFARLPKASGKRPRVVKIAAAQREAESLLIWSAGLASDGAGLAILLGRGRLLGPPIPGVEATMTGLLERMLIAGQDCECGLDRSWMTGRRMPVIWSDAQMQSTARELGFSPEDAVVKAEMHRIIARGKLLAAARAKEGGPAIANKPSGGDGLGYSEIDLDSAPGVASALDAVGRAAQGQKQLDEAAAFDPIAIPVTTLAQAEHAPKGSSPDKVGLSLWLTLGTLFVAGIGIGWWWRRHADAPI